MMSTDPVVVNKTDNQGSQFYHVSKGFNGPSMNGPNGDYPQQNSHYNPYGQSALRTGFPQNQQPRAGMAGSMLTPSSNSMMPPSHSNYNPNQQRMMGGNSVAPGGSTPTLNQLLQTPNSGQRYPQPSYGDFAQPKAGGQDMMGANPNYSNQNWAGQHRPMNPYQQQQVQGNPAFRNQGQMYGNRPNMSSGYSNNQHENQYGQYSPNNQRFPISGKPGQMSSPSYTQQMTPGYSSSSGPIGYNQTNPFMSSSQGPGVMPQNSQQGAPAQMSPSQSSSHATPPPHPAQPSPGPPAKPPDDHSRPSSQHSDAAAPPMTNGIDALSLRGDESNDSSIHSQKQDASLYPNSTEDHHQQLANSNNIDSQHNLKRSSSSSSSNTPTSSSQHNSVPSLRPPPSPAGSTGSRSTTPHSATGNQAGSPMPPRPPSSQVDGPGRITSPMNQGYNNSQMMPPPMGPNQMGYGTPNKMQHNPNMMHGNQMSSHFNQQYPTQPGSYGRPGQGIPGYGGPSNYNGPNQMGGNQMYPNNMGGGMNRGGMPPSNYYGQPASSQTGMGANAASYGYNNQSSTNMPPSQSMHSGMQGHPGQAPPPGQQLSGPVPQNEQSSGHGLQGPPQMHGGSPSSLSPHAVQSHRGQSPHMAPPPSQSSQPSHPLPQPPLPQPPPQSQSQQPQPTVSASNMQPSPGPKGAQAAAHAAMVAASQQHLTRPGMNTPTSQTTGQPPFGAAAPQQRPSFGQYPQGGGMQGYTPGQKPSIDSTSQAGPGGHFGYPSQSTIATGQSQSGVSSDMGNSGSSGHQSMPMGSNNMTYSSHNVGGSMGMPSQMNVPSHGSVGYSMNGAASQHGAGSMNSSLPPNAVAPTASNYGQNTNSNMGPPNMPPPSAMSANLKTEQGEPHQVVPPNSHHATPSDIKPDIKPDMKADIPVPQLNAGTVTTTTQSLTEPIMNPSVTSTCPLSSETSAASVKPATPQSVKQESVCTDESSQDSFKGPASKPEMTKQENVSLPPTLTSVVPSPGIGSQLDDFENISSPSWPGTPGPQKASSDVLQRQCEMGEEPERRAFLEQLFAFMEERGTPVQAMPQISKNYIDLYKLYVVVKEKGGLLEVTKNKKWREISTAISIGTSSSAGFTLKKNYCKLIFPFECKRDLGGIDPAPILAQVEAPQKKDKRGGSEFGRGGQGYDGYGMNHDMHQGPMMPPNVSMMPNQGMGGPYGQQGMMGNQGMGYQGNQGMMGNQGMGYQPNQGMIGNQGMGYQGNQPMGYQGNQGMMGNQMQNSMMANSSMGGQQGMIGSSMPGNMPNTSLPGQMLPSSNMLQNRGPTPGTLNNDSNSNLSQPDSFSGSEPSTTPNKQFPNSSMPSQVPPYSSSSQPPSFGFSRNQSTGGPMPPYSSSAPMTPSSKPSSQDSFPSSQYAGRMSSPFAESSSQSSSSPLPNQPPMPRPQTSDQSQMYGSRFGNQTTASSSGQSFPVQQQSGSYQGPPGNGSAMRRKPGMYPQQRAAYPPTYGSGSYGDTAMEGGAYPPAYSASGNNMHPDAWSNMMQQPGARYPGMGGMPSPAPYSAGTVTPGQTGGPFPQQHPRMMAPRPEVKPGAYQQPAGPAQKLPVKPQLSTTSYAPKKELMFPADSVEAAQPVLKKRKRLIYRDVGRVDPWRIMMALKSGQLLDSTWALDALNILLFDDHTVVYFGLQHMPGLLDVLLEHFRRHLSNIFESDFEEFEVQGRRKQPEADEQSEQESVTDGRLGEGDSEGDSESSDSEDGERCDKPVQDLKALFSGFRHALPVDLPEPESLFAPGNYTLKTRCGKNVKIDKNVENTHLAFDNKKWDIFDGVSCSKRQVYNFGKGDITLHIQTHMESDTSQDVLRSRFYKRKKSAKSEKRASKKTLETNRGVRENTASGNTCTTISNKCDSECRDFKTSNSCDDGTATVKTEPGVDGAIKQGCLERTVVESDQSKTEHSSSCSSDSGIHVKSETAENFAAEVKMEINPCDVKTEKCERESERPESAKPSDCVKLESVKSEARPEGLSACNENDKMFLSHLKRKWEEGEVDNEEYRRDETPLCLLRESQEEVARRCVCISNVFRSLSFIPGNDREMSQHRGLMALLGKLLLYRHRHNARSRDQRTFDKEVDTDVEDAMECENEEWWWPTLDALRENVLVVLSNISGQMNLSVFPEEICMPVLDGLLHWAICPSAYAQDPMPTMSQNSVLSPKKLVIETLAKLCVTDINVDLILATPPFSRIVSLFGSLIKSIADHSDQVTRELSLAILSYLVQGDSSAARAIALQHPAINLLLDFIEAAEARTAQFAKAHGALPKGDSSELLGTSVDMLRKAAKTLSFLAMVPENQTLFLSKQERILSLAMSNCMDSKVVEYLSDVLFSCSQEAL